MKPHKRIRLLAFAVVAMHATVVWSASCQDQCLPYCCFMTMLPETCVGSPVCPNLVENLGAVVWADEDHGALADLLEAAAASKEAAVGQSRRR